MKKWSIVFLSLLLFVSCHNKPNIMEFEVVFATSLGKQDFQLGSNKEYLASTLDSEHLMMYNKQINVSSSIQVFNNAVYIVDKYNKRVNVYNLNTEGDLVFSISNNTPEYRFDTPVDLEVNRYGEIYVLASTTPYEQDIEDVETAPIFYIYKFSSDGKFMYRIGENGIQSSAMRYPYKMSSDLFGNFYVYFMSKKENDDPVLSYKPEWQVKRFSSTGEINFEFNSNLLKIKDEYINSYHYNNQISNLFNLKNNEQLLLEISYIYDYNQQDKITASENVEDFQTIFYSIHSYSLLKNITHTTDILLNPTGEQILGVTNDDTIVFYEYAPEIDGLAFSFKNFGMDETKENEQDKKYFAPLNSRYYQMGDFFTDANGEIYNSIIRDQNMFILLHWKSR